LEQTFHAKSIFDDQSLNRVFTDGLKVTPNFDLVIVYLCEC